MTMKNKLKIKIVPSILSANFNNLQSEVSKVKNADYLQFDVMDGKFVENITFGHDVVKAVKTKLVKDVHLMVAEPERLIPDFIKAGSDIITFHIEATKYPLENIAMIKESGKKAGIAISPKTPISKIREFLPYLDQVIVMTVNPGKGGQKIIPSCLKKVRQLRKIYAGDIEVDGGMNEKTIIDAVKAGANVFVAGSFVFHSKNPTKQVDLLRKNAISAFILENKSN